MMESLIAFCVVLLVAAGVIVAFAIVVEYLRQLADRWLADRWIMADEGRPWPPVSPIRVHSKAPPLSCREREYGDMRPRTAATHSHGYAPDEGGETPQAPRSAEVLPFVRRWARVRPPLRVVWTPDAT
jgi:hypothetical protein